jgi:hypothetical protein
MWNWWHTLGPDGQVKLLALIGASIAFVVGLLQYRKTQRWKRAEWVAQEMKDFFADASVKTALQLLDWGSRRAELFPGRAEPEERFVKVGDDDLAEALADHSNRPGGFTPTEAALRDLFDYFLDRLERINSFVEAGLVSLGDVRPYLDYWAGHVVSARKDDPKVDRLVQLRRYIRRYGFAGVEALFTRLCGRPFPQDKETEPNLE